MLLLDFHYSKRSLFTIVKSVDKLPLSNPETHAALESANYPTLEHFYVDNIPPGDSPYVVDRPLHGKRHYLVSAWFRLYYRHFASVL